jgi:hypothetical protein
MKEAEESLKHEDLTTEVQCMWNIMSDTGKYGTISQLFRECLNEIPGKRDFNKVHCHTGHCMHTRESADVKYIMFIMESNAACTMYCNYRTAAILCTLETWHVSLCNCKYSYKSSKKCNNNKIIIYVHQING